jgi:hypothetical protein
MRRFVPAMAAAVMALLFAGLAARAAENDVARLADELRPLFSCVAGQREAFCISAQAKVDIGGKPQQIDARLVRYSDEAFDLELKHPQYGAQFRRRSAAIAFAVPYHKVVFVGRGEVDKADHLAPKGLMSRLVGPESMVAVHALALQGDAPVAALALTGLLKVSYDAAAKQWTAGKAATFAFDKKGHSLDVNIGGSQVHVEVSEKVPAAPAADDWPGFKVVELPRRELEGQLARGLRRALDILAPSPLLTSPPQTAKKVEHGELRWVDGQRVVLLHGTPEQIGRAHGKLLKVEAQRCIDSVLYTFGTAQTIRTGRWFRHDLEAAYARLAPHIPEDHKRETRALAESVGIDPKLAQTVNVFPELFHCSGFAVFGKATKDGKLYHGRVLDYMTTIGLQDSATTFIVAADGKIPFANVGYAGFIGSVSGMNAKAISLGEMGGRGEGKWDGAPMATLMRRGLEECSTLDDVMNLWKNSPRTCEYYYVFADGKTNRAVGVAATPESVQFVQPGEAHKLLGEGIEDAVVLSAGSRLEKLRGRVKERYGQIDADVAQWLMCRPVAMQSNLHNVLFVPKDGVLYVANADHKRPAAERPYVRLDLNQLLRSMGGDAVPTGTPAGR